ncbi:hypothetical protein ACHAQH_006774 [Verticillium albo-atrum]
MSRGGGRGGGRGGRGGRRGGGPQLPWEGEDVDARPSELFPAYTVPDAKSLTPHESRSVSAFLLLRHQIHDGPLYTTRKLYTASNSAFSSSQKHYGQAQLNAKYAAGGGGARTKANQDPFTAVPTYAQRFVRAERTLPDFGARPYCPEFVPKELHATFEGADGPGGGSKKRKRFQLSSIRALPTAEDVFGITLPEDEWDEDAGEDATKRRLEALNRIGREPEGEEAEMGEDEEAEEEEQDEEYDDEDAGDYNAEEYFENGDDMDDDGGDDDQGGDAY